MVHVQGIDSSLVKHQLVDHLLTSENWLKLLVMRNPDLGKTLQRIEKLRTKYSENLLELPRTSFLNHYANDLQALDSAYHQARSSLLNEPATIEFTAQQVEHYLLDSTQPSN